MISRCAKRSDRRYGPAQGRLGYAGQNILIYIDTLAPPDGFTSDQLTAFGQLFDQTLYPIDLDAFGAPRDVDQIGTVIMLLSQRHTAQQTDADERKTANQSNGP